MDHYDDRIDVPKQKCIMCKCACVPTHTEYAILCLACELKIGEWAEPGRRFGPFTMHAAESYSAFSLMENETCRLP